MFLHVKYIKEIFVKKVVIFLLFFFALLSSERPIQADMLNAPSSQVSSSQVAETGGQLSVVDEAGQIKAILSNIQGEIIGVTAQFSSETNSGITVTFSMDEQGRYVAVLDRSAFAEEDQVFSLKLTAQLTDGSFQTLSDYSFEWKKDVVSAAEKPTALNNSNAISSKIEEEATSTTTSSTVNSSLTTGATSSASNSLTRSSSNTIAGSSNGSISDPSARVSTASKVSGTITVTNVNASSGTFDVIISNVVGSSSVQTVLVPIWSDINGQDDLRWYSATRQSNGTYKVSVNKKDHKDSTGQYHIHLYYQYSSGRGPIVDAIPFNLPAAQVQGKIQVQNVNAASGTFDVIISNVVGSSSVQTVLVPIWSDINGQDDLRWYSATRQSNGTYKVSVNKKDHKDSTGQYHIHLYYQYSSGRGPIVDAIPFNLPAAQVQGKLQVQNVNASSGTFDVIISNVVGSSSVQTVLVPIWSDINGQDDLRWYSATRQSNGTYKVSVNKKDHKDSTGQYHIHLYYQYSSGRGPIVDGILFELPRVSNSPIVQIQNIDSDLGSFEVNISQVAMVSQDQKILVPIWSDINGQDDLRWYSATRQSDGTYKVSVNKKDHKYSIGKYHIHVYYDSYGSKNIVATTTVNLPSSRSYTVYIDPGHGGRDSGASYGGVHEKNLALSVANKLRDNLVQRGINVLMTRDGDYDVDFKTERSRMTNESNADLFISIHFNATGAGVSNSSGIETYWYQYDPEYQPKINKEMHNNPTRLAESEILANKVQESLIKETGAVNRGVRRETFAVLRETAIPAILVELGFMDNPSELQVIKQDSYHTRLAKALAQGVMNWYGAVEGK
ncbi:GBS Bsp-like repeat-containing protein [Streptococcus suis]|uniref:GBS Bsp-like repeat-containing protein n=3 Tax=Streptococcus suis TaxID=1307 RepID=UPI000CF4CF61|nr:GBS Bsp-like repeat-containing protein [Streptococcus suis]